MNDYIILNRTTIQQRIEDLEYFKNLNHSKNPDALKSVYLIDELKQILSQSTALIPEIEKAYDAGGAYTLASHKDFKQIHPNKKQYISNLKLDI